MDFPHMQKALRTLRIQRNAVAATTCVLLAANALLALELATQSNQVVLIPTAVSDGMVARGARDKRYLEALALDAVYGLYNASPKNLDYGRTIFERLASVEERARLLAHFDTVANDIREREISTVFFTHKIEHDPSNLQVVVEGDLMTFVNTVQVSTETRRVLLGFVEEAGSVRLSRINRLEPQT